MVSRLTMPAFWLVVLALLSSCGGPAPPLRETFYRLDPPLHGARHPRPLADSVQVAPLATRGFAGGTQIVFRLAEQPLVTQRYRDYLWEEPPGQAIAGALAAGLRATGLFRIVLTGGERARAEWLLGGQLSRFEHWPTHNPPQVAAEFALTLLDAERRSVRFTAIYAGTRPVHDATPSAMAAAFSALTGDLLAEALHDLAALALDAASGDGGREPEGENPSAASGLRSASPVSVVAGGDRD